MFQNVKPAKIFIVSIVCFIILIYVFYQARNIIRGPIIIINQPQNGETFKEETVTLNGFIKNASFATLNNNPLFVNENGELNEDIVLSEGYNLFEIVALDKFDRKKIKKLELIYRP